LAISGCARRNFAAKVAALLAASALASVAHAETTTSPTILNLWGEPGLLDMPGGHMSPDGAVNVWASGTGFTQRYGFSFQALPWFEGAFRYIGIVDLFNADKIFSGGTYYDRQFAARIRLKEEADGWPDITMGFDDTFGTGLEAAEYVVASKHAGPLDFTLGMGWGRLADTAMFENPIALLIPSFAYRPPPTGDVSAAGKPIFDQYFHGPNASLFGGMAWQTPIDGLSLLLEYSSDNYRLEAEQHIFRPATQFNVGASYQVTSSLQVGAAYMYGRTPMLRASFSFNPKADPYPQRFGAPPLPAHVRSDDELRGLARANLARNEPAVQSIEGNGDTLVVTINGPTKDCTGYAELVATARERHFADVAIADMNDPIGRVEICSTKDAARLLQSRVAQMISWQAGQARDDAFDKARDRAIQLAAEQGLEIEAIGRNGNQVNVAFTNRHYRTEPEAYGRLARVLMATMPPDVEMFRIVSLANGTPTRQIVLPRSSLERVIAAGGGSSELLPVMRTEQTAAPVDEISPPVQTYPTYDWALLPEYNQSLFDPNQPYRYQVLAGLRGGINLLRELRFEGEFQANVLSDFSGLEPPNSQLPHVRSDLLYYYDKGKNGIAELQGSYLTTLAPGLYGLMRAGILESMFAGGGGEILWRPDSERWALGATLYEAWQRGFLRQFDLMSYHVLTGHVSAYYESPWYGLDFRADVGRYLAGDSGGTVTISRRFDTGVEIGLFATLTNVPFSKFGEGAFDKGFLIRIPLDFMTPLNSQSEFDMALRPVMRDGGQMLNPEQVIYDTIRRTSYGDLLTHADQIPSP
jgi:hypothetical protein